MSNAITPPTDPPSLDVSPKRPAEDTTPYGNRARLLDATDEASHLKQTPVGVFCPNCGTAIETHDQGLPPVIPHFDTRCSACDVGLRRWCAVVVDTAYTDVVTPTDLTKMTQAYWNRTFWQGITDEKDNARKREYIERFSEKAADFGWKCSLSCPLCRRDLAHEQLPIEDGCSTFDYHHWSNTPDRGITLCRDCHKSIGFECRDADVEARAHQWGFRSANDIQIIRLALREAVVSDQIVRPEMAPSLTERYNLTHEPSDVAALIDVVCQNEDLKHRFVDDSLYRGLPTDS